MKDWKDWENLPKAFGRVQQLQVEDGPNGPTILFGLKPDDSTEMQHFGFLLDNISNAYLQILLWAIAHNKKVRITYDKSEDSSKNLVVAIRVHAWEL